MRELSNEIDDDWYESLHEPYDLMEVLFPKVSGFLSFVGSSIIMAEIIVDHKAKKGTVISRVIFNLCIGDLLSSFAFFLSSWPVPTYSDVVYAWNVGNEATCSAQGFILILGMIATPWFNVVLAWCQYKIIANGTPERKLQMREKYFYGCVWTFALTFSSVVLALGMFNAEYFICSIAPYPRPCTQSWEADEDNPADCIRGDNAFIALSSRYLITWIAILCVFILFIRTIRSVKRTEERSVHRTFVSASSGTRSKSSMESGTTQNTSTLWRTRLMRQHAYRYMAAFFIAYSLPTIQAVLLNIFFHPILTPIMLNLIVITLPLQGFMNFLVFSGKREMKTAPGRLLKKLTYTIFQRCCCWPKHHSDSDGRQRTVPKGRNDSNTAATRTTGRNLLDNKDTTFSLSWSTKHPKKHNTELVEGGKGEGKDLSEEKTKEEYEEQHNSPPVLNETVTSVERSNTMANINKSPETN